MPWSVIILVAPQTFRHPITPRPSTPLALFGTGLFLPSGYTIVLTPTGSAQVCRAPVSTSSLGACGSASALQSIGVILGPLLSQLHLNRAGSWLNPGSSLYRFSLGSSCYCSGSHPNSSLHCLHPGPALMIPPWTLPFSLMVSAPLSPLRSTCVCVQVYV